MNQDQTRSMNHNGEQLEHKRPVAYKVRGSANTFEAITSDRCIPLAPTDLLQLLGPGRLRQLFEQHRTGAFISLSRQGDEEEDEEVQSQRRRRTRRKPSEETITPTVPNTEGQRLMNDGLFGATPGYKDIRRQRKLKLAHKLMQRELGMNNANSVRSVGNAAQVRGFAIAVSDKSDI